MPTLKTVLRWLRMHYLPLMGPLLQHRHLNLPRLRHQWSWIPCRLARLRQRRTSSKHCTKPCKDVQFNLLMCQTLSFIIQIMLQRSSLWLCCKTTTKKLVRRCQCLRVRSSPAVLIHLWSRLIPLPLFLSSWSRWSLSSHHRRGWRSFWCFILCPCLTPLLSLAPETPKSRFVQSHQRRGLRSSGRWFGSLTRSLGKSWLL